MPVIHEYQDGRGLYIKANQGGRITTYQVSPEGATHLRRKGCTDGTSLSPTELQQMVLLGHAYTGGSGPGTIDPPLSGSRSRPQTPQSYANGSEPQTKKPSRKERKRLRQEAGYSHQKRPVPAPIPPYYPPALPAVEVSPQVDLPPLPLVRSGDAAPPPELSPATSLPSRETAPSSRHASVPDNDSNDQTGDAPDRESSSSPRIDSPGHGDDRRTNPSRAQPDGRLQQQKGRPHIGTRSLAPDQSLAAGHDLLRRTATILLCLIVFTVWLLLLCFAVVVFLPAGVSLFVKVILGVLIVGLSAGATIAVYRSESG